MRSRSVQPRKQRLAWYKAPYHQRRKMLSCHLSESLLVKYNRRSFPVAKGDTVKILRGAFRGHEEKIASVDLKLRKVTIEGVTVTKSKGDKKAKPLNTSILLITRLNLTDPRRRDRLARTAKVDEATKAKLREELEREAKDQAKEIETFKKTLAERETEAKEKRKEEEGELEARVDPVTQKPVLEPKQEEAPAHAGGERLEEAKEHTKGTGEKKEETT